MANLKCSFCEGSGIRACRECYGEGECASCRGEGRERCRPCGGTGEWDPDSLSKKAWGRVPNCKAVAQLFGTTSPGPLRVRALSAVLIARRMTGASLLFTGNIAAGRMHFDRAIALYNPLEDRPLATRFYQDSRVMSLSWLSLAMCLALLDELAA